MNFCHSLKNLIDLCNQNSWLSLPVYMEHRCKHPQVQSFATICMQYAPSISHAYPIRAPLWTPVDSIVYVILTIVSSFCIQTSLKRPQLRTHRRNTALRSARSLRGGSPCTVPRDMGMIAWGGEEVGGASHPRKHPAKAPAFE